VELGGLTVEVSGGEPLAEQLDAAHLGLDAAAVVVATPLPRERPAEAPNGTQSLVAACRAMASRLPALGVPAGRDDRVGSTIASRQGRSS
jgi:hypothetical protein